MRLKADFWADFLGCSYYMNDLRHLRFWVDFMKFTWYKKAGRVLPAFLRHLGDASGNTAFAKEIKLCSRV